jgi:tRNA pseudouridine55 synthase
MAMDGILIINKSVGMTSHDVVARVRRLTGQRRVGHAGTLDPAATGTLPVLLGQATRVAEYLSESGKAYRAIIRFGIETETYDAEGAITSEAPVHLTSEQIEDALPDFLGEQEQIPPVYSAIKRGGVPLYALARAGKKVQAPPRHIVIESLRVVAWESPDLTLDVECGKGTYIRSLAHDLGQRLGPGAHLAGLTRTRSGPFTLAQAITLDEFAARLADGMWRDDMFAADEALLDWRAAILGVENGFRLRTGQHVTLARDPTITHADGTLIRAYSTDGRFLGILRWNDASQEWLPHKTLVSELDSDEEPR